MRYDSTPVTIAKPETPPPVNAAEGVERQELSSIAGGDGNIEAL